jgi:hypothetical protein
VNAVVLEETAMKLFCIHRGKPLAATVDEYDLVVKAIILPCVARGKKRHR